MTYRTDRTEVTDQSEPTSQPNPLDAFRLDHRRAVVTGAASGIGRAIAVTFAQSGAQVILLDLNAEKAAEAALDIGHGATSIACDVSSYASVDAAFEEIASQGACDILVNSAGIAHIGTIETTSPAEFDRLFNVNVRGTYLCMKAALTQMSPRQSGVILNVASIAATSGLPDRFAYSMTKGAVLSMTLSVARDFLASKVRCNCISPARIHTPFVDGFVRKNYPGRELEMLNKLARSQPVGRMGQVEEVALLALYLCSDASSFVTGTDYPLDGGYLNLR